MGWGRWEERRKPPPKKVTEWKRGKNVGQNTNQTGQKNFSPLQREKFPQDWKAEKGPKPSRSCLLAVVVLVPRLFRIESGHYRSRNMRLQFSIYQAVKADRCV